MHRLVLIAGMMLLPLASAKAAQAAPDAAPPATSPAEPDKVKQAEQLLQDHRPDEAIALLDPVIAEAEADKNSAKDAHAICPAAAGAFLAQFMAQSNMSISVSVANDWCNAMLLKGYALGELKRFDEEAQILSRLIGHDPRNPRYLAEYAYALQSSGKPDEARKVYQKVKSIAGDLADPAAKRHYRAVALRGLGFIASDSRQWDEAQKLYEASLKDEPGNEIALHELEYIRRNQAY